MKTLEFSNIPESKIKTNFTKKRSIKNRKNEKDVKSKTTFNKKRSIKNRKDEKEEKYEKDVKDILKKKNLIDKKILIAILIISTLGVISIIIFIKLKTTNQKTPIKILISDLNYEDSKSVLNLAVLENNEIILNNSLNNIDNSLTVCNNPNISEISTTINYNPPSFLENPIKSSLKIVKTDLELYNNKYIELSEELNNLTQTSIEILKNLSYPIENMKNELKNAYEQFKDLIKNKYFNSFNCS